MKKQLDGPKWVQKMKRHFYGGIIGLLLVFIAATFVGPTAAYAWNTQSIALMVVCVLGAVALVAIAAYFVHITYDAHQELYGPFDLDELEDAVQRPALKPARHTSLTKWR